MVCIIASQQLLFSIDWSLHGLLVRVSVTTITMLAGTVKLDTKSLWKTSLATAYPIKLARRYAQIALSLVPSREIRQPDDGVPPRCVALGTASLRRAVNSAATSEKFQLAPVCARSEGRRFPADAPEWGGRTSWAPARCPRPETLWCSSRRAWPPQDSGRR